MGTTVSCLHPPISISSKKQAMVMKENGVILRFKEGILVKDVLESHPRHQLIQHNSERARLPDSFRLCCNELYFLLPRGTAAYDKSVERLLRKAAPPRKPPLEAENVVKWTSDDEDDDVRPRKSKKENRSRWKPSLQTIPEATLSALLQADF